MKSLIEELRIKRLNLRKERKRAEAKFLKHWLDGRIRELTELINRLEK